MCYSKNEFSRSASEKSEKGRCFFWTPLKGKPHFLNDSKQDFYLFLVLLLCSFLMDACKNSSRRQDQIEDIADSLLVNSVDIIDPMDVRKPLFLRGLYATSSAKNSDIRFTIDDNTSNMWKSRMGTGPDEGLMLQFFRDTSNFVQQLIINQASDEDLLSVEQFFVHINGAPFGRVLESDTFLIDTIVHSLYLRVGTCIDMDRFTFEVEGQTINQVKFPVDKAVGISSIRLIGYKGEEYRLIAPKEVAGKIIPSSNLNPIVDYHAGLLFDARLSSAWAEGAEGSGIMDSLVFELEETTRFSELEIWNGYQLSDDQYLSNPRVKQFSFGIPGQEAMFYNLEDHPFGQRKYFEQSLSSDTYVFKIHEVYTGFAYSDLAISELLFFEGDQPIRIETNLQANFEVEYQSRCQHTILDSILNRRIYNEQENETESFMAQSIILHSNATFVFYSKIFSTKDTDQEEMMAEGSWQILEASTDRGRVELNGILYSKEGTRVAYEKTKTEYMERAFKDELIISNGKLKGNRVIGVFYF